jgi:hypothetical protein
MPPDPGATTVEQELTAMRRICNALDQLDSDSRRRVMHYLTDRYHDTPLIEADQHASQDHYATDTATPR